MFYNKTVPFWCVTPQLCCEELHFGRCRECTRSVGLCGGRIFVGCVERLDAEEKVERYMMIEVLPEEYKDEISSDVQRYMALR